MSTGNKKALKKSKKANEKDKRMEQLEKEIARLENENGKLKRDSVEYKNRLAAFGGATRLGATEFPKLNLGQQSAADNRFSLKSQENFEAKLHPNTVSGNGISKRKVRAKTMRNSKKSTANK